jgi:hypothetical protein
MRATIAAVRMGSQMEVENKAFTKEAQRRRENL